MLKNLCQLEFVIEDKACRFICDNDTDINVIKEALFQFQKFIGSVEDIAKAQKEAAEKCSQPDANAPVVEPVAEVVQEPEQAPVENQ